MDKKTKEELIKKGTLKPLSIDDNNTSVPLTKVEEYKRKHNFLYESYGLK